VTKLPLSLLPPSFLVETARALHSGNAKYSPWDWRTGEPVSYSAVLDSILRHLVLLQAGEDRAQDSGVMHAGHISGQVAKLLDALSVGNVVDDRPRLPTKALDDLRDSLNIRPSEQA